MYWKYYHPAYMYPNLVQSFLLKVYTSVLIRPSFLHDCTHTSRFCLTLRFLWGRASRYWTKGRVSEMKIEQSETYDANAGFFLIFLLCHMLIPLCVRLN
jgi:hypothetical protein